MDKLRIVEVEMTIRIPVVVAIKSDARAKQHAITKAKTVVQNVAGGQVLYVHEGTKIVTD